MDSPPVTLEGSHVRLEPLSASHVSALAAVGIDADLWRWTTSDLRSVDDVRRYVEDALRLATDGSAIPFATVERATGIVVGSTRFGNIDAVNRRVEIGWTWIARQWQRTAINTEAKYLMLRHAFEEMRCIRVEFKTDALNARSRAAIVRIGATEEGVLRHHMIANGGRIRDTVYYSILEAEWPDIRRSLEHRLYRS